MDFQTYLWSYDKRWGYGVDIGHYQSSWMFQIIVNIFFALEILYHETHIFYSDDQFSVMLKTRALLLIIQSIVIAYMLTWMINKKSQLKALCLNNHKMLYRQMSYFNKLLLSSKIGVIYIISCFMNLLWGLKFCSWYKIDLLMIISPLKTYSSQVTSQIMFNQIFLIHIFFTMAFFSLKVIFIGIYILYPRIAKRIVDFHNIMNHDKKNLEYQKKMPLSYYHDLEYNL